MGRDDVNAALNGQEPGTFLIRFSETHYGQFAIAYNGSDRRNVKHYLVQPTEYVINFFFFFFSIFYYIFFCIFYKKKF